MTYATEQDRQISAADAAPVRLSEIVAARQLVREGKSMKEAAEHLGITPSGKLDLALWRHLGEKDADLLAAAWVKA